MFNFFNKKAPVKGEQITTTLSIKGMHCTSCAMNIDGDLEDLPGVERAETSYANSKTKVTYNPQQITEHKLKETIKKLGYDVL